MCQSTAKGTILKYLQPKLGTVENLEHKSKGYLLRHGILIIVNEDVLPPRVHDGTTVQCCRTLLPCRLPLGLRWHTVMKKK